MGRIIPNSDGTKRDFACVFQALLCRPVATIRSPWHLRALLLSVTLATSGAVTAGTVSYEYDELGRLIRVERVDASVSTYEYDAGGNRDQTTVALTPGVPASINVPASSTGTHTISWAASSGTVTEYELYQSNNSNFSGEILAYSGTGTSTAVSVQNDGTYYYRVRACNGSACSGHRPGSNGVSVTLPPGPPMSITVPSSSTTGSFTISWGDASTGTVDTYKLYEATSSNFSNQSLVHDGAAQSKLLSGRGNGTYYYRVSACNGSGCSGYRTGGNALVVTLPPGTPPSIIVPNSSTTGTFTISWGLSSGTVTAYKLYEATNPSFTEQNLVYNDDSPTSTVLPGRGNGTYYYRVRACNGSACSGYRTGANPTTVTLPPSVPASITVPSSSGTGTYTISWGSSSGNVTAYELYEATSSNFSGQALVHNGTVRNKEISGNSNGTYYYRVRACNGSSCSGYRTGANPTAVTLPPAPPATISGPFQSTGSYTISWSSSATATRYELWESQFGSGFSKVYDGSNTAKSFNSKPAGEYKYKANACNAGGCSGFSPTRTVTVCNGPCL